ncbi:MAG: glutaredoxin family protein [Frankiales bacterium]|nr:glutaredoxin family protein [Frankiales bacterium]
MTDQPVRVVVLSKAGCHLCEDACAAVARIASDLGVAWREQDITDDAELLAQWAEYVPVILVDGEVHDWFRVREDRLRAVLSDGETAIAP